VHYQDKDKWAFNSKVWDRLELKNIRLNQLHRQKDPKFQDILNKIRNGVVLSKNDWEALKTRKEFPDGICAMNLYSRRVAADTKNDTELGNLKGPLKTWTALNRFQEFAINMGREEPDRETQLEEHSFPSLLELKVGAKVVLLANLDQKAGLVNGSQGKVISFEKCHLYPDKDASRPSIHCIEEGQSIEAHGNPLFNSKTASKGRSAPKS
jgi:ATP-dependent DNA helicase PIF1